MAQRVDEASRQAGGCPVCVPATVPEASDQADEDLHDGDDEVVTGACPCALTSTYIPCGDREGPLLLWSVPPE